MTRQHFRGVLEAATGGGAYVVIPTDVVAALGGGSRFRVVGSVRGVDFQSSTMSAGAGRVVLGMHKATRAAAGVEIGDEVEVAVERDSRPRTLDIPDDLAQALAQDTAAQAAFDDLSFSHRREYVEWLTTAKRADTRRRRLDRILDTVQGK